MEAISCHLFQTLPSSHPSILNFSSSLYSTSHSTFSYFAGAHLGFPWNHIDLGGNDLNKKSYVIYSANGHLIGRAPFRGFKLSGFPLNSSYCLFTSKFSSKKKHRRQRDIIARSELVGTSSSDSGFPLAEFQLGSRLRGIGFYTVTSIVAIFLFVVMLILHPYVLLFDRHRRKVHHEIAKIWASLSVYPFINVEFEGLENLPPPDAPAVYVSNHQSFLDIYTLLILGRSFKFISKRGIFMIPIIGWAMFLMNVIPLRRMDSRSQLDCLKRCIDLVRKGASVFFFPEGTRSRDGKLGAFKKGAFSVAAKTGVPVVPISLMGTGKLMPSGMEGMLNMGSIKAVIHRPIEGSNPELLCENTRNAIADVLVCHGHEVRHF